MNIYALWILCCSCFVAAGWFLSLVKELNAVGYTLALALFAILIGLHSSARLMAGKKYRAPYFKRLVRRFRHPMPLIYLLYLIAAFVGGALYAPSNYDALCYRIPRVLHWWDANQWYWIGGWNGRMDWSATGFEWLMLPQIILLKSDRFIFLINVISYALLPGMIYSSFIGLGIAKRVAWFWMWILPCAYCFVLQAGSIGNDTFAAVYFLAAIAFAVRSVRQSSWSDAMVSILAAALLTGTKASNIPLLLPLALVMVPMWRICLGRPAGTLIVLILATGLSFLPLAISNAYHSGDWAGDPHNVEKMKLKDPVAGILGNTLQVSLGAIAPPLFPFTNLWKSKSAEVLAMEPLSSIQKSFPRLSLELGEMPIEESAGLGLGVLLIILVSVGSAIWISRSYPFTSRAAFFGLLSWAALLVYMTKMGSESGARLISPYYPGLLIPLLAFRSQACLTRQRWWKETAVICALTILPALLVNPARPLLPMQTLLGVLEEHHIIQSITPRAKTVYSVYGQRSDQLAMVRNQLPSGATAIGFVGTSNESEYSLWRPLGDRRVVDLTPVDGKLPDFKGVDCIVGSEGGLKDRYHLEPTELSERVGGKIFWQGEIAEMAGSIPSRWFIIVPKEKFWK